MAKSMTPPQETFFTHLTVHTEHGSHPSLTTRDRELVSVLEVRIEPGDLNPRSLTPQSHSTNSTMGCVNIDKTEPPTPTEQSL